MFMVMIFRANVDRTFTILILTINGLDRSSRRGYCLKLGLHAELRYCEMSWTSTPEISYVTGANDVVPGSSFG